MPRRPCPGRIDRSACPRRWVCQIGRVYLRFLPVIFFVTLLAAAEELKTISGCALVPVDWADGDSFPVRLPDGSEQTVRIYGADCIEWHVNDESDARRLRAQRRYFGIAGGVPEESISVARGFGEAAGMRTRELLAKPFTIHTAFADGRGDPKFHRIYAFVTTGEGKDLSAVLVREGLARAFGVARRAPDGSSAEEYRSHLMDLELTAASARRGVWAKTDWNRLPEDRREERREEEEIAAAFTKKPPVNGIDPNTASEEELALLPGVGEVLAKRIVEGRAGGGYGSATDLLRVKGISPKMLEGMIPSLRFTNSPSDGKSPASHD